MVLKKSNKITNEIELSFNEKSSTGNKKSDSFYKTNKKLILFLSLVIIIFTGVGVLVGILVNAKKTSSIESQEITSPITDNFTGLTTISLTDSQTTNVTEPSTTTLIYYSTYLTKTTKTVTSYFTTTSTTKICNGTTNSINYTQPSIRVNSLNGTSLSSIVGIIEIMNNISYFIIIDVYNNKALKLNEDGRLIKSTTIIRPRSIANSQRYIYVNSDWTSIIKLNYDLVQISTVINSYSYRGIHYDLSNNNIYVASYNRKEIYVYHTNDEITFTKIKTISTSYYLYSITINNDKIYTGTYNGSILVYNRKDYSLIQVMNNMCPRTSLESVKFDCYGNMIYSCVSPPMVKIIGINGKNATLLLNDMFSYAYETYIDSKNRMWIGGSDGFSVYN